MIAPILIPLAILGGMDGVEPLRDSATPRETLVAQPRQTACRKARLEKIEPCDRFGGGRETVTFERVLK